MSSQGKTDTNNKGKAREEIAQASGSGPSAQVHPDEQGSDMGSTVSHLDLSTLSTTPPLHTVNKNIGQWLNTTQTPSGAGSPSMQNQENAMLSSDPGSMILDELSQELNTLATRPLNTRGKPGTSAPANTPQSCDHNGLRARAHSTGDANGRRLRMGPQANTMDGSVLPLPLFSKSNSSTAAGTSTSTPQAHQTSTIIDEIQLKDPGLPGKSVKSTSSPHATPQAAGVTETNLSTSLTMDVSPNPECSTGTPALAGTANSSLGLAQHVLQLHQGIPVSAAHLVVENTVGRPSALTNAVPSISSPAVAGIDGNVHGPAQDLSNLNQFVYQSATQLLVENMVSRPSSPLIIRQNAQQTADLPTVPPSTAPLEQVVNEPESVHHSPTAPLFHDFSSIGRRHSLQASTGEPPIQ
jgi:hypothetical protein